MYYLLLEGNSAGCHYTIGCNKTWRMINCASDEIQQICKDIINEYTSAEIKKATLLEVISMINIDLAPIYNEWHKKQEEINLKYRKEQYELLKKEFGE